MPTLAVNRKARAEFTILDTLEAGIRLVGAEVKSAKAGEIDLHGSYVTIDGEQAFIKEMHISPYKLSGRLDTAYRPTRQRQLLLNKNEIKELIGKTKTPGLTLIPLSVYTKRGLVKVEVALVTGKKKHDRRREIKKRETDRTIRRALRQKP